MIRSLHAYSITKKQIFLKYLNNFVLINHFNYTIFHSHTVVSVEIKFSLRLTISFGLK